MLENCSVSGEQKSTVEPRLNRFLVSSHCNPFIYMPVLYLNPHRTTTGQLSPAQPKHPHFHVIYCSHIKPRIIYMLPTSHCCFFFPSPPNFHLTAIWPFTHTVQICERCTLNVVFQENPVKTRKIQFDLPAPWLDTGHLHTRGLSRGSSWSDIHPAPGERGPAVARSLKEPFVLFAENDGRECDSEQRSGCTAAWFSPFSFFFWVLPKTASYSCEAPLVFGWWSVSSSAPWWTAVIRLSAAGSLVCTLLWFPPAFWQRHEYLPIFSVYAALIKSYTSHSTLVWLRSEIFDPQQASS